MTDKLKKNYTIKDSSHVFMYAILVPQLIGIIVGIIGIIIAANSGVDYDTLVSSAVFTYVSLFISQLSFLLVYFIYNKLKKIDFIKASKLNVKVNYKQVLIAITISVICLVFFSPIVSLIDYLISLTGYEVIGSFPLDLTSTAGFIVGVLSLAVLPSISEELVFRGIVYNGLQKLGKNKAIILSAVIFAIMHLSIQQTFYQIIIGIVLAYAVYITGGLLVSIVIHFTNNFIIIFMGYLSMKASENTEVVYSFNTLDDYLFPIVVAIVGGFIILKLFKLLKNVSEANEKEPTQTHEEKVLKRILEPENKEPKEAVENKEAVALKAAFIIASTLWLISFIVGL